MGQGLCGDTTKHGGAPADGPESYTPREHIQSVHDVLGVIDVDPASSEFAQRNYMGVIELCAMAGKLRATGGL